MEKTIRQKREITFAPKRMEKYIEKTIEFRIRNEADENWNYTIG